MQTFDRAPRFSARPGSPRHLVERCFSAASHGKGSPFPIFLSSREGRQPRPVSRPVSPFLSSRGGLQPDEGSAVPALSMARSPLRPHRPRTAPSPTSIRQRQLRIRARLQPGRYVAKDDEGFSPGPHPLLGRPVSPILSSREGRQPDEGSAVPAPPSTPPVRGNPHSPPRPPSLPSRKCNLFARTFAGRGLPIESSV